MYQEIQQERKQVACKVSADQSLEFRVL